VGDAAVIAELRGATLAPGSFAAANAASALIARVGTPEQRGTLLTPAAEGTGQVLIAAGGDALWADGDITADRDGDTRVVAGSVTVFDASPATTHIVVVPNEPDAVVVVPLDAPGVRREPMDMLDLTRSAETVVLDDVRVVRDLQLPVSAADLQYARAVATTLAAAETVGSMARLLDMTVAYAKDRTAFGRPIGSFQALKHLLADVSLVVEQAKAVSAAATRSLRERRAYAAEVASIAKIFLAEQAVLAAQDCLQVHGGIGFTWEHDLHLYLRRIASDAALFGTSDQHRALILAAHADELRAGE
jgi:alkylation response protein AidB-like acyl-CoA dehydrogenase